MTHLVTVVVEALAQWLLAYLPIYIVFDSTLYFHYEVRNSKGMFDSLDWPSSPDYLGDSQNQEPPRISRPIYEELFGLLGLVVRSHFKKTNAGLD